MIVMLDTSEDLKVCQTELGCDVEQLLTPLTGFAVQYPDEHFAIDNGAFSCFNASKFMKRIHGQHHRKKLCRFVACPDVVGSARRTLEVFEHWQPKLEGWPIALVVQDGQEDLPIPWDLIIGVFIGGSTEWKESHNAAAIIKAAKALGKWVHVGRVNTPGRFEKFEKLGADSIDGTGLAMFTHMRKDIHDRLTRPRLPIEGMV